MYTMMRIDDRGWLGIKIIQIELNTIWQSEYEVLVVKLDESDLE